MHKDQAPRSPSGNPPPPHMFRALHGFTEMARLLLQGGGELLKQTPPRPECSLSVCKLPHGPSSPSANSAQKDLLSHLLNHLSSGGNLLLFSTQKLRGEEQSLWLVHRAPPPQHTRTQGFCSCSPELDWLFLSVSARPSRSGGGGSSPSVLEPRNKEDREEQSSHVCQSEPLST